MEHVRVHEVCMEHVGVHEVCMEHVKDDVCMESGGQCRRTSSLRGGTVVLVSHLGV